jgi:hypothetical protein
VSLGHLWEVRLQVSVLLFLLPERLLLESSIEGSPPTKGAGLLQLASVSLIVR